MADVALPFGDRFSWIKGGLEFDALRQACIDPRRASVGAEPPRSATPSQVIAEVRINNGTWAQTRVIPLNPGLVAIIGARGSGKTALADVIAAGCDAIPESAWRENSKTSPSFLARARDLIGNAAVQLTWAAGAVSIRSLDGSDANDSLNYPRARYLSQQFVEELCSSSGLSDSLLTEIERVIFDAHPLNDREGASDFAELLEHRATRHRLARKREADAVAQISERISAEFEKERLVETYQTQVPQKTQLIAAYTADRAKLVSTRGEAYLARHTQVTAAAEKVRSRVRWYNNQRQTLLALQDEVKDLRRNQAPETLRQTQARHPGSGMNSEQWTKFLLDYKGDVDGDLTGYISWADNEIAKLKGVAPTPHDDNIPYITDDADLGTLRGIVLLLLYLALDDADDRPLIIDQPEENLDPKSVFDELVALFIEAKSKRQVIMVTHNANLVVNTDADQVIIAEAGPSSHGALPPITYVAGGLEIAHIRKAVCDILEGGENAFKERARRLRVRLDR